ncbi:MAG TPA: hypothetical protein VH593_26585 [Ktedonobacteraceae bacterium]|jgi:hypothetical protein
MSEDSAEWMRWNGPGRPDWLPPLEDFGPIAATEEDVRPQLNAEDIGNLALGLREVDYAKPFHELAMQAIEILERKRRHA